VTRWRCTCRCRRGAGRGADPDALDQQHPQALDGRPVTMPSQDMIIGIFWLTPTGRGGRRPRVLLTAEAIMAFDAARSPAEQGADPLHDVVPPRRRRTRRLGEVEPCPRDDAGRRSSTNAAGRLRLRQLRRSQEALGRSSTTSPSATPRSRSRAPRRAQGPPLPLGDPLGVTCPSSA
jgi:hypothetical protein